MIVLDASLLIAHFNTAEPHHADADRLLREAQLEDLIIHPLTLAEVLVGGARGGRTSEMFGDILSLGVAVASYSTDEPVRLAELRASTKRKLPDCCILHLALSRIAKLATFDLALAATARELGITVLSSHSR